jgi:spore germination cell wall hydrolase CwlJ-like protein
MAGVRGFVALRPRQHQAVRCRPKGRAAHFAMAVVILTMPPGRAGPPLYPPPVAGEDISIYPPALAGEGRVGAIAGRPVAGASFRAHLIASPFGTIHLATFRFPQPVGTGLHAAAYTLGGDDAAARTGVLPATSSYLPPPVGEGDWEFPEIDRSLKGPRLVPRLRPNFSSPQPSTIEGPGLSSAPQSIAPPAPTSGASEGPAPDRAQPATAKETPDNADFTSLGPETAESWLIDGEDAPFRAARIYFGTASLGGTPATIEPWGPGQAPIFEPAEPPPYPPPAPTLPSPARGGGLGRGAGEGGEGAAPNVAVRSEPSRNETIAPKGEVTGEEYRPKSPAERLGLIGAARPRHEKCLADAIYFEARGESVRGQMAVAQVVINRVFSGYYPNNICGVVYQNAHRRFRCQFTFACDGLPERINEPLAWERAKHIARDALDGNFWLNDVGKATHYHARWVHPWWVHEMRRLDRIGVHTFYRPRNWGDGSKAPTWGDAEGTAAAAKTL